MTRFRTLAEQHRLPIAAEAVMLWVAAGPWLWGFAASRSAIANHVFLLFAFGPMAMLIAVLRPAAFVTLAAGIWLALSPWLLGYATINAAWVNELVSGLLLAVVSLKAAGIGRLATRRSRTARTAAGARAAAQRVPSRS